MQALEDVIVVWLLQHRGFSSEEPHNSRTCPPLPKILSAHRESMSLLWRRLEVRSTGPPHPLQAYVFHYTLSPLSIDYLNYSYNLRYNLFQQKCRRYTGYRTLPIYFFTH